MTVTELIRVKYETKCRECGREFFKWVEAVNQNVSITALREISLYCPACRGFTCHAEGYPRKTGRTKQMSEGEMKNEIDAVPITATCMNCLQETLCHRVPDIGWICRPCIEYEVADIPSADDEDKEPHE